MAKKVMAVDDEADVILVLKRILEKEGFEVYTALGGKECMDSIGLVNPDILFLDVMMPDMTGWEVMQELKDRDIIENVKIIMLTVVKQPKEEYTELSQYVLEYMTKPFSKEDLIEIVKSISAL